MGRKTFSDVRNEVAENAPPARPEWLCFAWGCPLRGTIFSGGERKCYLHDGHAHIDMQALTREIKARQALFHAAEALMAGVDLTTWWSEIPGRFARPFRDHGRTDLLPTVEERLGTVSRWYARVRGVLELEVLEAVGVNLRSGRTREAAPKTPVADTWQGVGEIAGARA